MSLDPVTVAKLWLLVKPISRIRKFFKQRKIRKASKNGNTEELRELTAELEKEPDVDLISNIIRGAVRHLSTAAGGWLVANDLATESMVDELTGVLVAATGLGFSIYRKWRRKQQTGSAE